MENLDLEIKLKNPQIQQIRQWLADRGVYYLDIREEITDHIASQCEHLMLQNELSFTEAFAISTREFKGKWIQPRYTLGILRKNIYRLKDEVKSIFTDPFWTLAFLLTFGVFATISSGAIIHYTALFQYDIIPFAILILLIFVLEGWAKPKKRLMKNASYMNVISLAYLSQILFWNIFLKIAEPLITNPLTFLLVFSSVGIFMLAGLKLAIKIRKEAVEFSKILDKIEAC
ncbi:hypothetical protein ACFCT7_13140 [Fulvivirgaceae bacterium LMO-SS25]